MHAVNAQHGGQRVRPTAISSLGIVGLDNSFETRPWNQLVHSAQELLLTGLTALVAELAVGECKLLIHLMRPRSCAVRLSHVADLITPSLAEARRLLKKMEQVFASVLHQAQAAREIDQNTDCYRLARYLQMQFMGLRAYARATEDHGSQLQDLIDDTFAVLCQSKECQSC